MEGRPTSLSPGGVRLEVARHDRPTVSTDWFRSSCLSAFFRDVLDVFQWTEGDVSRYLKVGHAVGLARGIRLWYSTCVWPSVWPGGWQFVCPTAGVAIIVCVGPGCRGCQDKACSPPTGFPNGHYWQFLLGHVLLPESRRTLYKGLLKVIAESQLGRVEGQYLLPTHPNSFPFGSVGGVWIVSTPWLRTCRIYDLDVFNTFSQLYYVISIIKYDRII